MSCLKKEKTWIDESHHAAQLFTRADTSGAGLRFMIFLASDGESAIIHTKRKECSHGL